MINLLIHNEIYSVRIYNLIKTIKYDVIIALYTAVSPLFP